MTFVAETGRDNSALQKRVTRVVHDALGQTATPGASVSILLDGQAVYCAAVGYSDLDQQVVLDRQAQFYSYSITKSLIAAVVLQLAEQEYLTLDQPVQMYLPEVPLTIPVTLRQLLNHTGGVPDYGALASYAAALRAMATIAWTPHEFLAATLSNGLAFAPGQGWSYSNIGYLLLRQVIEHVSQSSLADVFQKRLFAPLHLTHLRIAQTLIDGNQLTPGYSTYFTQSDRPQDIRTRYHPGWVSHGVVIATAAELACVLNAIFTGELLQPASRAAMFTGVPVPVSHPLFRQPAYGLGVMIDQASRYGLLVGHGGGGPGYSAGALHLPDAYGHQITTVALTNRNQDELGLHLAFTLTMLVADSLAPTATPHPSSGSQPES